MSSLNSGECEKNTFPTRGSGSRDRRDDGRPLGLRQAPPQNLPPVEGTPQAEVPQLSRQVAQLVSEGVPSPAAPTRVPRGGKPSLACFSPTTAAQTQSDLIVVDPTKMGVRVGLCFQRLSRQDIGEVPGACGVQCPVTHTGAFPTDPQTSDAHAASGQALFRPDRCLQPTLSLKLSAHLGIYHFTENTVNCDSCLAIYKRLQVLSCSTV